MTPLPTAAAAAAAGIMVDRVDATPFSAAGSVRLGALSIIMLVLSPYSCSLLFMVGLLRTVL